MPDLGHGGPRHPGEGVVLREVGLQDTRVRGPPQLREVHEFGDRLSRKGQAFTCDLQNEALASR
ncbi:MAG: hypothetical protein RJQ04_19620 [Longimicrobiales bacterium]